MDLATKGVSHCHFPTKRKDAIDKEARHDKDKKNTWKASVRRVRLTHSQETSCLIIRVGPCDVLWSADHSSTCILMNFR
eukprot:1755535-Amphidinium_carterae.2